MESQRPDALIKDEKAMALVAQLGSDVDIRYNFALARQVPMSEVNKVTIMLRNREFDRYVRDFMRRHPKAVVIHIGCGLDTRFERVDNGQVEWYDLDLPEVIKLRWKLIGGEGERYHLVGCSVFDDAWINTMVAHSHNPSLFMAEGFIMYFEEGQVKSLVLRLRDHFPGAELVFDACSPLHVWVANRQTASSKLSVQKARLRATVIKVKRSSRFCAVTPRLMMLDHGIQNDQ